MKVKLLVRLLWKEKWISTLVLSACGMAVNAFTGLIWAYCFVVYSVSLSMYCRSIRAQRARLKEFLADKVQVDFLHSECLKLQAQCEKADTAFDLEKLHQTIQCLGVTSKRYIYEVEKLEAKWGPMFDATKVPKKV
jgi:hypothetical protein